MLTKSDNRMLGVFERRLLRSIFGAVQDKGHWKRKWHFKL
jgi:hypothetical protein